MINLVTTFANFTTVKWMHGACYRLTTLIYWLQSWAYNGVQGFRSIGHEWNSVAACSLPPLLTIILKTATSKRFLCFNLQYTHFNFINTVAVRNFDPIGRVHQAFVPHNHFIITRSLLLNYSINKRQIFTLADFISMKRLTFLAGNWAALQTLVKRFDCNTWLTLALPQGHSDGLRTERIEEKIKIKTRLYRNTISFPLGCTLVHFANRS